MKAALLSVEAMFGPGHKAYEILEEFDFIFYAYCTGGGPEKSTIVERKVSGSEILDQEFLSLGMEKESDDDSVRFSFHSCESKDLIREISLIFIDKKMLIEKKEAEIDEEDILEAHS